MPISIWCSHIFPVSPPAAKIPICHAYVWRSRPHPRAYRPKAVCGGISFLKCRHHPNSAGKGLICEVAMDHKDSTSVQLIIHQYLGNWTHYFLPVSTLQGLCEHCQGEGSTSSQTRIAGWDLGGQPWLEDTLPTTWHIYQWFGVQPQPWSQSEPLLAIHQKSWSFPVVQGSFQSLYVVWFDFINSQKSNAISYLQSLLYPQSLITHESSMNENNHMPFMPPMHCCLRTYLSMMTTLVIHGHQRRFLATLGWCWEFGALLFYN